MSKSVPRKVLNKFQEFFKTEQSGGIILIICTVISLILANSGLRDAYHDFWHLEFGYKPLGLEKSVNHWINDGLMTIFFLLVGLEIKREIIEGELSSLKKSMLPILAAIGGMLVPAVIYSIFNLGKPSISGWGIPMATDIAFAIGIMALLGNKVPFGLRVMLTALAIVDDLGAIVVIAVFYTSDFSFTYLLISAGILGVLILFNYTGVKSMGLYVLAGLFLWYFILKSGIHATISGVLLAMCLPLGKGNTDSAAEKLQHVLHKPVSYLIMPLFALSNTGFSINTSLLEILEAPASIGIILGLFVGKPLGIFSFSWLAVKTKLAQLPARTSFKHLFGAGMLGGIGFTMSIFIALLAFTDENLQADSKLAILVGSLLSGLAGYFVLNSVSKKEQAGSKKEVQNA